MLKLKITSSELEMRPCALKKCPETDTEYNTVCNKSLSVCYCSLDTSGKIAHATAKAG